MICGVFSMRTYLWLSKSPKKTPSIIHHHQGSLGNEADGLILFQVKFVALSQTGQHILASQGTLNFLKVKIAAGVKKAAGAIAVP